MASWPTQPGESNGGAASCELRSDRVRGASWIARHTGRLPVAQEAELLAEHRQRQDEGALTKSSTNHAQRTRHTTPGAGWPARTTQGAQPDGTRLPRERTCTGTPVSSTRSAIPFAPR